MNRITRNTSLAAVAAAAALAFAPQQAFCWGHAGHVGIARLAAEALPAEVPAFVRSAQSIAQIAELGAEADQSKTTGTVTTATGTVRTTSTAHDHERDNGHFVDIDDAGYVLGGLVPLTNLPLTREAYDTAQRNAVTPGGQTQYTAGYLPYAMIDGFQQIRKDFGIWRVMNVGLAQATTDADKAWFRFQLQLRQQLIIRDIGYWAHFVGDASQPMHVSVHYNGWGNYPNPNGYTTSGIHSPFEGAFVKNFVDFAQVAAAMRPYTDRGAATYEQRVPLYLAESLSQLVPVYQAAKDSGNDNYRNNTPQQMAVVLKQLAAGASELRDQIVDAWRQSANVTAGYPLVRVSDAEAGRVRITPSTFGAD